ncbi:ABC transporter substrate-binding protein [Shewanella sp. TC10]|uniref:ABC transporter substrate-binding protein n=1 Tax=Shewanella sp. TC10 TaxID=1419739 RepID=UPI00129DE987|nr:ABC transporter substrate-binding protein [Shewanella sp. TC10]
MNFLTNRRRLYAAIGSLILSYQCYAGEPQQISAECYLTVKPNQPERVVVLNQFAVENMLMLGLQGRMLATAFPDEGYNQAFSEKLASIPQLSPRWPSKEQLLQLRPDFIYAGFPTAFGPSVLGEATQWQQWGVGSLKSAAYCNAPSRPLEWQDLWTDISQLAEIFDRKPQLAQLRADKEAQLAALPVNKQWRILHLDGLSQGARVAGSHSAADLLIRLAGGVNVAQALPHKWGTWSWEQVLISKPEVIVIAQSQSTEDSEVIKFLTEHPLLQKIDAVKHRRFITVPFSQAVTSPRLIEGVVTVNQALNKYK